MNFSTFLAERAFALGEKRNLNHAVFEDKTMKADIKKALMRVADAFVEFVDSDELKVVDIVVTGSLANYTWHDLSDIDLHIVADYSKCENEEDAVELFTAKKSLWNMEHTITIKGFPVELYIQGSEEEHVSSGVYSLKKDKWLVKPKKINPSIDDTYVIAKADKWKDRIDRVITHKVDSLPKIDAMKLRLRNMRKMGLDRDGEFSVENLAFKILRRDDYIDKLYDYASELEDNQLSLD
jgi:predicted nucleotidyltransferase